jgi:pimeloyl-ACP methyl ester carboxylesterase
MTSSGTLPPSRKLLVLFIHGLGGDGTTTWGIFPELLRADPDFDTKIDVALFRYPTQLIRWPFQEKSVRIQDLAASVRTEIDVRYKSYDEIVLVCHSMGGLIAQKYIISELKEKRSIKVRGIILYGIPQSGADLARWGSLISWRHWHLKQLRKGSDLLQSIQEDWAHFKFQPTMEIRLVSGGQDVVVTSDDNSNTLFIPDKGHINLVKPASATDTAYLALKELLIDILHARPSLPTSIIGTNPAPLSPNGDGNIASVRPLVLFDIYRPECEPYYIQRREDTLVRGYLSMQNVWLYGPSGYGKTAALTRALSQIGGSFRLIPLGHYLGVGPKGLCCGMYEEFLLDQVARKSVETMNWAELISAMVSALEALWASGVRWILVEEMPLHGEAAFREFFSRLCSLLMLYAQRNPSRPISFAFSSVNDPRTGLSAVFRMAELLKVVKFGEWRRSEAESLVTMISNKTKLIFLERQLVRLIDEAKGSPRFTKVFFGNYLNISAFNPNIEASFEEALASTQSEMLQ